MMMLVWLLVSLLGLAVAVVASRGPAAGGPNLVDQHGYRLPRVCPDRGPQRLAGC